MSYLLVLAFSAATLLFQVAVITLSESMCGSMGAQDCHTHQVGARPLVLGSRELTCPPRLHVYHRVPFIILGTQAQDGL